MKKILLSGLLVFLSLIKLNAQTATFTVVSDTVHYSINSMGGATDNITNTTASAGMIIKWRVIESDFPADWRTSSALGICDNNTCWYNFGDTLLWNGTTGIYHKSDLYAFNSPGLFNLTLNFAPVALGTHYIKVELIDTVSMYTKNVTFVVTKKPTSVANVTNSEEKVTLYPNPAKDEINIVYDASSDIKNIAVYNIIGKMMSVYKVNTNSANLNIENLPSGIYFVKLYNGNGNVMATRKFTKQ